MKTSATLFNPATNWMASSDTIGAVSYACYYIAFGRLAAENLKRKFDLCPSLCRLALQLEATARSEAKGHIRHAIA
jgi:hypothetical protein